MGNQPFVGENETVNDNDETMPPEMPQTDLQHAPEVAADELVDDAQSFPAEPPTFVSMEPVVTPPKPKSGIKSGIIAGVVSGLIAGVGGYQVAVYTIANPHPAITLPATSGDSSPRAEGTISSIAAAVLPTVVSISVSSDEGAGTGSGFVIRSDDAVSYILTNHHVVSGAGASAKITVVFQDQSEAKATVVGSDAAYDLAVIKVNEGNLPVSALGDSQDVVVGDTTIAIGSPLGLSGTVTSGIVSALNRPVTAGDAASSSFINAIQTDAAVNPGNSGGPLVNANGQVIGVNSAIATTGSSFGAQSGSIGLGFAIPINQAKRVAEELINTGKSSHPIIGVTLDLNYTGRGAQVSGIREGGPAVDSGLKVGDIITEIDGWKVSDGTELVVRIRSGAPGDEVVLTLDSGETVTIVLGSESN